ncbi:MAG: HAD-IIIC family phosphatase, partial [Bacteroidales bacterium]|nr:HAD-IIIC family phosphatase [Bacteroidales bacterium]
IPEADRYVWFYLAPLKYDTETAANEIIHYADMLGLTLSRIPGNKMVLAFTMDPFFGIHTVTSDAQVAKAVNYYNNTLYELGQDNVKVVDISGFTRRYSAAELFDWKYYFISQMVINQRLAPAFKEWFYKQEAAIEQKRKKCLVLDMDNTLWGGVLGEDGIDGIQLGGAYPGKAFLMFQHYIEELGRQGVILTACSKNNMEDVRELWDKHPDCVLKEKHFAILKINWNNKADNIRQMAAELNIGLDSMVFLDDNPTERALVKNEIPEVEVPDFPEQPYMLPVFLKEIAERYFAVYALTKEDRDKTEQYRANAQRNSSKVQFANMEEYIRSLEIVLTIAEANEVAIPRVAQMTQKTNQFNLTTQRYTDADIKA